MRVGISPVVADDQVEPASPLDECGKLSGHTVTGNRGVPDGGQALMGEVIDDVQGLHRRPLAIWSWTKSSVQRAFSLASTRMGALTPMARLRPSALANPQPFLPVEPVDAVDA